MSDKENLAFKLAEKVFKHYELVVLEEQYGCKGGELFAKIFNEIYEKLNITPQGYEPVIFIGENEIPD